MSVERDTGRGGRIRLVVAYDGSGFHGFARQSGLRTVQGVLEDTISGMLGVPVQVHGSGRTDAGVHARAQVIHFDQAFGPTADRYVHVLSRRLPADIIPVKATEVDSGFHARFSVVRKSYRYSVHKSKIPDVFRYRFTWNVPTALDLTAMRRAANHLVGEHDFTSFCAAAAPQENKIRTLYRFDIEETDDEILFYCEGNGFLQYMVRIMVGTVVDVGLGKFLDTAVPDMLSARSRASAGRTAPPQGLCLWNVEYPPEYGGKVLDL